MNLASISGILRGVYLETSRSVDISEKESVSLFSIVHLRLLSAPLCLDGSIFPASESDPQEL